MPWSAAQVKGGREALREGVRAAALTRELLRSARAIMRGRFRVLARRSHVGRLAAFSDTPEVCHRQVSGPRASSSDA